MTSGSGSVDVALALFVSTVPGCTFWPTCATIVTVFVWPFASGPMLQPAASAAAPHVWLSETYVIPLGSASVRVTVAASDGPLFFTWMENVTCAPGGG